MKVRKQARNLLALSAVLLFPLQVAAAELALPGELPDRGAGRVRRRAPEAQFRIAGDGAPTVLVIEDDLFLPDMSGLELLTQQAVDSKGRGRGLVELETLVRRKLAA
jgi:hypothetical protein